MSNLVETPWHSNRFFPAYNMHSTPPTPVETLNRAKEIGLAEGLKHVYVGNAPTARIRIRSAQPVARL
jgi:pyruvate formate lyase activating enzyme